MFQELIFCVELLKLLGNALFCDKCARTCLSPAFTVHAVLKVVVHVSAEGKQLDLLEFLEDVSSLIHETS